MIEEERGLGNGQMENQCLTNIGETVSLITGREQKIVFKCDIYHGEKDLERGTMLCAQIGCIIFVKKKTVSIFINQSETQITHFIQFEIFNNVFKVVTQKFLNF